MNSFSWTSVFRFSISSSDGSSAAPVISFSRAAMAWAMVMAARVDQCWSVTISRSFMSRPQWGSTSRLSSTSTPSAFSVAMASSAIWAEWSSAS